MSENLYHYTECGLDNVFLENGYETIDTKYGKATAVIDYKGLHKVIGEHLVYHTQKLNKNEIRFLRVQAMMSQNALAEFLDVSETTVRNWESSRAEMPGASQLLLKALYLECIKANSELRELREAINQHNRELHEGRQLAFRHDQDEWREDDDCVAA